MATLLIEHGAGVDARLPGTAIGGGWGQTALIEAAQEGKAAMLSLLIENKADLDAQDQYGQTALHRAAFNGMLLVVQLLVQAGCKTDIKDVEGILAVQKTPHWPPCPCYWFAFSPCSGVQPSALQRYPFRYRLQSRHLQLCYSALTLNDPKQSRTPNVFQALLRSHSATLDLQSDSSSSVLSPYTIPGPLTTVNPSSHSSSSLFPLNHPYGNNLNPKP